MAEQTERGEEAPQEKEDVGQWYAERRPEFEPTEFREGFTLKTILGAVFVAVLMMPGAVYLGLLGGPNLGPAVRLIRQSYALALHAGNGRNRRRPRRTQSV